MELTILSLPLSLCLSDTTRTEHLPSAFFSPWNPMLAGVADPDLQGAAGRICTAPLPRAAAVVGVEPLPRTKGTDTKGASAGRRRRVCRAPMRVASCPFFGLMCQAAAWHGFFSKMHQRSINL